MHEIPQLDRKGLRRFGLMTSGLVATVFGLVIPYLWNLSLPAWPWIIGVVLGAWALVWPQGLNPIYRGWMKVGLAIGSVVNRVVLGFAFYLLIFPIGLLMRLVRGDPLARELDSGKDTYRLPSKAPRKQNMENPF